MRQTYFGDEPVKVTNKKIIKSKGIRFFTPSAETPEAIIHDCEEIYGRDQFYALSSGGKDSQTMTDWLAEHGKLKAVVHIKTNVGLRITLDFLKDFCQSKGYRLHVIEPQPKFIYAAFVLQYGFPGPALHGMVMGALKLKTMRDFILSADRRRGCLVGGVRKFESHRRLKKYPQPINSDGNMFFAAPMFYYTNEQIYKEYTTRGLPISPAYKMGFGTSGECLCGAFATHGEKELIQKLDPTLTSYLQHLEELVQLVGTPQARKFPTWGGSAKMTELEEQQILSDFFAENPHLADAQELSSIICGQECGPGTMRGMIDY